MIDWCWVRLLSAFQSGRIYSNLGTYNAVNNGLESRCMVRKVQNSGKNTYFPYLWQFLQGSKSVFLKIPVIQGWFLKILWSQFVNNDVISEIHVFLGVEIAQSQFP